MARTTFQELLAASEHNAISPEGRVVALLLDDYIYCPENLRLVIFDDKVRDPGGALGRFYFDPMTDPLETQIDYRKGDFTHLVMCHELGHLVEIGLNRAPARIYFRAAFHNWRSAVVKSPEVQMLLQMQERAVGQALVDVMEMLSLHELWARSFAQYFAEVWQDSEVSKDFQKWKGNLKGVERLMIWEDFGPIKAGVEDAFKRCDIRREPPMFDRAFSA